jgi:alginate O-acetyltransferase complex protein AlgI
MMGVRLPINFNSPYKADSIIDFWRRWHMTLSRFLRNYLYIPLGGKHNRLRNIMLTMLLGGLWHGAGWTFVLWGGLHGLYLVINYAWRALGVRIPVPGRMLTFLAVIFAWIFFRAENVPAAIEIMRSMVGVNGVHLPVELAVLHIPGVHFGGTFQNDLVNPVYGPLFITILLIIVWYAPNTQQVMIECGSAHRGGEHSRLRLEQNAAWGVTCGIAFALSLTLMGAESPFLYFRF